MPISIKRDSDNVVIATATNMSVTDTQIDVQNAGLQYTGATRFVIGTVYRITQGASTYRVRYANHEGLGAGFKRFSRR